MSQNVLAHFVGIKFHDGTPDDVRKKVFDDYQTLAERAGGREAGILAFNVDWNLDQRKNWHLVEEAVFTDDAALQAFRVHPAHKEVTDVLAQVADWVVLDYMRAPRNELDTL